MSIDNTGIRRERDTYRQTAREGESRLVSSILLIAAIPISTITGIVDTGISSILVFRYQQYWYTGHSERCLRSDPKKKRTGDQTNKFPVLAAGKMVQMVQKSNCRHMPVI